MIFSLCSSLREKLGDSVDASLVLLLPTPQCGNKKTFGYFSFAFFDWISDYALESEFCCCFKTIVGLINVLVVWYSKSLTRF